MEKKLSKICKYRTELKLGSRYCLSDSPKFEHSFIVVGVDNLDIQVTYLDGVKGRLTYEPFTVFEYPLTSLEKELM